MLAAVAHAPCCVHEIRIETVPKPREIGATEVVVRMLFSTFNPSDQVTLAGSYASRTVFPFVPGFEGVGVIERVGAGVPQSAIGQRVLPIGSPGAWQELKRTDYSWCIPVPDDISTTVACFAYINPLTALLMVQRFGKTAGTALVDAETTTISRQLCELLTREGVETTLVGRDYDRVADAASDFDVLFDCVGGETGRYLAAKLKPEGVVVHFGLLSGQPLGQVDRKVEMFRLRDVIHATPRVELPSLFDPIFAHLRAGRLRTDIAAKVSLSELPHALAGYDPRQGKLLIQLCDFEVGG